MKSEERKNWEREQRKNRIIDFAETIFFEKGYDGATIEDIAGAAGYNKRTVYLYFNDKEELFLAAVSRGLRIFMETLKSASEEAKGEDFNIIKLARAFYRFSIDYSDYFTMVMIYESQHHRYYENYEISNDSDQEGYDSLCQSLSIESGRIVTEAIEEDIAKGLIQTFLTPRQMMLMLWGQIFGVMQIILMRKNRFEDTFNMTQEQFFEEFLRMARLSLKN